MKYSMLIFFFSCVLLSLSSCVNNTETVEETDTSEIDPQTLAMKKRLDKYVQVPLTSDLSKLSDNEIKMVPYLIKAAEIMDNFFWQEAYGDKNVLFAGISDIQAKTYADINYGPWDRLEDNNSFIEGIGEKPAGANFYPKDMTKAEFEEADLPDKASLYTFIRR
ncbi:MAG: Zn-dependent hydrolase, partial [Bacteroidetes bacterium]|nr:Zn-dependent hydrolase [Bacteroidota bacterium]